MREVADYYDNLVKKHGISYKSVNASSQEALDVRHKALAEVTDLEGKSILDVGCGQANIYTYLKDRVKGFTYTGIDVSGEMIRTARVIYPNLDLIHTDLCDFDTDRKWDIVLSQGIFYKLPTHNSTEKIAEIITRMIRLSNEVVAFMAISTMPYGESTEELRLDPLSTLGFLYRFTPYVQMRGDYRLGDIMFALFKEENK